MQNLFSLREKPEGSGRRGEEAGGCGHSKTPRLQDSWGILVCGFMGFGKLDSRLCRLEVGKLADLP